MRYREGMATWKLQEAPQQEPSPCVDHAEVDRQNMIALSEDEDAKVIAAMASIDAGRGLAFEEVFQELENLDVA
jgi:hypothetical protein